MLVYKEDFTKERQDREKTQCERDQLQEQLQNCQELIVALNQEVGVASYFNLTFSECIFLLNSIYKTGLLSDILHYNELQFMCIKIIGCFKLHVRC